MAFPSSVLQDISHRLSDNSWRILEILEKKDINLVHLMKHLELNQSKFYAEISRLDGAVLIDQTKDPKDSRAKILSINPNGKALLAIKRKEK